MTVYTPTPRPGLGRVTQLEIQPQNSTNNDVTKQAPVFTLYLQPVGSAQYLKAQLFRRDYYKHLLCMRSTSPITRRDYINTYSRYSHGFMLFFKMILNWVATFLLVTVAVLAGKASSLYISVSLLLSSHYTTFTYISGRDHLKKFYNFC